MSGSQQLPKGAHPLLQVSPHAADEGRPIGRDPRTVSAEDWVAAGVERLTAMEAIRAMCIWCCNGQLGEVRKCTAVGCPLLPLRMGKYPPDLRDDGPEPADPGGASPDVLLEVSDSDADGGHLVGRNPMTIPPEDWAAAGITRRTAMQAIRAKCRDCGEGTPSSVRECEHGDCPLWQLRMGCYPKELRP